LLGWFRASARQLPWRGVDDPYLVWISEVMLQQTRVTAVIPYFERFIARFPTIRALAEAPEEDLLKAWAGLGYYSRARNLQKAAISMGGEFPRTYEAIRALPGVGDYTAAAVGSIAFGLPYAAVDGNVVRVIARLTEGIGDVRAEAQARLDRTRPGEFNEAMMELGATVCLPRNPQCLLCPVACFCAARASGRQHEFPAKRERKMVRADRSILIIRRQGSLLFWRRPDTDRKLAGFWELPEKEHLPLARVGKNLGEFRHSITNVNNFFTIYEAQIAAKPTGYAWLPIDKPVEYLFSTTVRKALQIIGRL
jgi:A/G-specific adenine glycosylase